MCHVVIEAKVFLQGSSLLGVLALLLAGLLGCIALSCFVSQLSSLLLLNHKLGSIEGRIHSCLLKVIICGGCLCLCESACLLCSCL